MAKKKRTLSFAELCARRAPTIDPEGTLSDGQVIELVDKHPDENNFLHQSIGTIAFKDPNTKGQDTASFVEKGGGFLGNFQLGPVNQSANTVSWVFSVQDSTIDFMKEGETRTQEYDVTIKDFYGKSATQTVTITIIGKNDGPIADDEVNSTTEDTKLVVNGGPDNLLTGDFDVDGDAIEITGFKVDITPGNLIDDPVSFKAGETADIAGVGKLTINSDGSYVFDPAANYNGPVPVATYTIKDTFGATDDGTLTITVDPADDPVTILGLNGVQVTVDEDDLSATRGVGESDGTSPNAAALTQTGSFTITAADGIKNLDIGGTLVITNGVVSAFPVVITTKYGELTITAVTPSGTTDYQVDYSYELLDNTTDHSVQGEDSVFDSISISVEDNMGPQSMASATLDVEVIDDIPSITISVTDGDTVKLETQDADTIGANSDTDKSKANFADAFQVATSAYGADGPGSITWDFSLALKVADGTDSGLTSDGDQINLFDVGGVIVGATTNVAPATITDASVVFSISVDGSTGEVTLTQHQELDHPAPGDTAAPYDGQVIGLATGLVELSGTATITDGDSDSATSSTKALDLGGNICFADTGPSITISVTDGDTVKLETQDADTIGANSDTDKSKANFADAFQVATSAYGADGPGSITWDFSLALKVADGTDSGLTSDGDQINLFDVGGVIVGATTNVAPATITDASVVFSISVDGSTGEVTLTQHQELDHPAPGDTAAPYDGQVIGLATGLVELSGTATITDGDSDSATSSTKALDLGGNICFADTGPSITISVTDGDTVKLETQDADTIGANSDTDKSKANFADAFQVATSAYGADGPGSITWDFSLALKVADGTDSGLTSDGDQINLFDVGGVIVGATTNVAPATITDASVVFSISVDGSTGEVTLTQHQELDHPAPGDTAAPYDGQVIGLATGLVELSGTATITDGDSDSATSSTKALDLGGNICFADTGPSITISVTDGDTVKLETQDADTIGANSDTDKSKANFADAFQVATSAYGADGPGSITWDFSLALKVADGTDSGLTSDGDQINLFDVGGVIVGATTNVAPATITDASVVFSISVDGSTGEVTLTQHQELDHPAPGDTAAPYDGQVIGLATGLVELSGTATITDGDSDSATSSTKALDLGGNICFADTGPSITISVTDGDTVKLETQDADTIGANSDTDKSKANFADAFQVATSAYGADGPGSITWDFSLALKVADGTDSGLTSDGDQINLFDVGGVIVGATTNVAPATITDASVVFSISVDGSTGEVTLTQHQELDHPAPGDTAAPYDGQVIGLATGLVELSGTATITDGDSDSATSSTKALDLGGNICFADTGPSITISVTDGDTVKLETQDADTIGANSDTDKSKANFADAFQVATSAYGADGPGSITWDFSLALKVADGTDSGLTSDGDQINLFDVGGVIVGATTNVAPATITDASVVFSISVDGSTGEVTLTQHQELDHPAPGDTAAPYDGQVIGLATGLVELSGTATITDGDSDSATSSTKALDLGGNICFADTGPTARVLTLSSKQVSHDETPGEDDDADDKISTTSVTFNGMSLTLAALFSLVPDQGDDPDVLGTGAIGYAAGSTALVTKSGGSFGADGPATSGAETFSLSIKTGAYSGVQTTEGTDIFLYEGPGGLILGRVGIEDAGGDKADEDGTVAFALALDPLTGTLYTAQYLSLLHPSFPNSYDESISLDAAALVLKSTLKDGDGDTATSEIDVGSLVSFQDAGPSQIKPDHAVLLNEKGSTITAQLDIDGDIDLDLSSDGGTIAFVATPTPVDLGLTSGGKEVFYTVSKDGLTLTASTDSGANTIFTVKLNPDGDISTKNDTYTVTMVGTLDGGQSTTGFQPTDATFHGGNDPWAGFFDVPFNDDNSKDLLLTPTNGTTINTNKNSAGVDTGASIGVGEAMRLDYVTDLTGDPSKSKNGGYAVVDNQDHTFDGHYMTNGATVSIAGIAASKESVVYFRAFDDPDGNNAVGDGTRDDVTSVTIFFGGETEDVYYSVIGTTATDVDVGGHTFNVQFQLDSGKYQALISHVVNGTTVATYTGDRTEANGYNSLEVGWSGGTKVDDTHDTFSITQFGIITTSPGIPVNMELPVALVDGDGDTLLAELDITLAPSGTGLQNYSTSLIGVTATASALLGENINGSNLDDKLTGDAANNVLYGDAGNDTIIGGNGTDLLIGGAGGDKFVFVAPSNSPSLNTADTIYDFDTGELGEVIDLSQIDAIAGGGDDPFTFVVNATPGVDPGVTKNSITWYQSGAFTIVQADVNGDTTADLVIKLNGALSLTAADFVL